MTGQDERHHHAGVAGGEAAEGRTGHGSGFRKWQAVRTHPDAAVRRRDALPDVRRLRTGRRPDRGSIVELRPPLPSRFLRWSCRRQAGSTAAAGPRGYGSALKIAGRGERASCPSRNRCSAAASRPRTSRRSGQEHRAQRLHHPCHALSGGRAVPALRRDREGRRRRDEEPSLHPADRFPGQAEAADFTLVKGQQIVDMEGDRIFR